MRKTFILLVMMIALVIGLNFRVYGEIPSIGQNSIDLNITGKWICIGYNITDKSCTQIQTYFQFDSPEKDSVKAYQNAKTYTVYDYVQDKNTNRLIINGYTYYYSFFADDTYMLIEFPSLKEKTIYGFYQVYFLIKAENYTKDVLNMVLDFYNNAFLATISK
jgi:hypothetical protein